MIEHMRSTSRSDFILYVRVRVAVFVSRILFCRPGGQWKKGDISPMFKALVDINNTHSQCRLCMKAADKKYNLPGAPYGPERAFARMQLEDMAHATAHSAA